MAATTLPADMQYGRTRFIAITGLSGSDVGALPDQSHKSGGGYHCGCQDIIDIGKWASAGSVRADYSVRQARDRVGGNTCSAHDVGDNWPNGGRAAWIRWNNLLVAQMRAGDKRLSALRAVNFTPDGTSRKRYDSFHPEQGIINSTDTVDGHTHLEYWRDTVNTPGRKDTIDRIAELMEQAISNQGGSTMDWTTPVTVADGGARPLWQVLVDVWNGMYQSGGPAEGTGVTSKGDYATKFPRSLSAQIAAKTDGETQLPSETPVDQETVLAALESERGQAAITKAANVAEDS